MNQYKRRMRAKQKAKENRIKRSMNNVKTPSYRSNTFLGSKTMCTYMKSFSWFILGILALMLVALGAAMIKESTNANTHKTQIHTSTNTPFTP